MKNGTRYWQTLVAAFALVVGLLAAPSSAAAQAVPTNPGVVPPAGSPYGKTYGEWSAAWWQWGLSQSSSTSPLVDDTGARCSNGQAGNVWFLAGSFTDAPVRRTCAVPAGTALFVPLVNVECSTVEGPPFHGDNEAELRQCTRDLLDGPTPVPPVLSATLDGRPLTDLQRYRVQSPLFTFAFPQDNVLGVPGPGTAQSISDGYWLLLAPLTPGSHTLHFEARLLGGPFAGFGQNVTYHLTVAAPR